MLWKSFVLPIIEYCSVLWCPSKVGNIQRIEALQWSFMRKLNVATNCNYWDVLKKLNLFSLQRRRDRYRIIYIWKILEQTTPNINDSIQCYWHPHHGRKCKTTSITGQSKIDKIKELSLLSQFMESTFQLTTETS